MLSLSILFVCLFPNGCKNTFLSGLQAGALDLHSRCAVTQCYVLDGASENPSEDCKKGSPGSRDGEKEEEKACQDRLVRRLGLKWANNTLNRGPTPPRPYLLKSPHSQIWRCYYYPRFSAEKPEALRGYEIGLQLTYSVVEPGFEPKSK